MSAHLAPATGINSQPTNVDAVLGPTPGTLGDPVIQESVQNGCLRRAGSCGVGRRKAFGCLTVATGFARGRQEHTIGRFSLDRLADIFGRLDGLAQIRGFQRSHR